MGRASAPWTVCVWRHLPVGCSLLFVNGIDLSRFKGPPKAGDLRRSLDLNLDRPVVMQGHQLSWDTIVVVQWDMVVYGPIQKVFSMLQRDQVLLSGLRPIDEVEQQWSWTSPDCPDRRAEYLRFLDRVQKHFDFDSRPLCCLFVVVCLSRGFLDQYSRIEQPELGFLEYRVPIYAQVFRVPFCTDHPFEPWWDGIDPFRRDLPLMAWQRRVDRRTMLGHLLNPWGARVFHPYRELAPIGPRQWIYSCARAAARRIGRTRS